jgi:6-pyruvoyltetrahydropterin/6-carboxytetrahydropterin synthase
MFRVRKSLEFSAAHALRDYEGPCSRIHGHNYRVEVEVQGEELDGARLLIDFYEIDRMLRPLIGRLDHQFVNEIPPFDEINPTAEAMAAWFYRELTEASRGRLRPGVRVAAVHLWETSDSCASYGE